MQQKINTALKAIFFLLIIERVILFLSLPPVLQPDSDSYKNPAITFVQSGDFGNIGYRTPGYPLFLASIYTVSQNDKAVILVQHLLGLMMILLIMKMTPSGKIKIVVGVLFLLDALLLLYEHAILADFLVTFELCFAIYFLGKFFKQNKLLYVFLSSSFIGVGFLTKPILKLYPHFILAFIIIHSIRNRKKTVEIIKTSIVFLIPVLLLWGGWSFRNYKKSGDCAMTSLLGMVLISVTEDFIDFSSNSNYEIKQVYKGFLEKKTARGSVIWPVRGELIKMGYDSAELDRRFSEIAKEAIFKYPGKYIKRSVKETLYFFLVNDSVLVFFSHGMEKSSMIQDFKSGRIKDAVLKFILNGYIIYWLMLSGFVFFFIKSISNIKVISPINIVMFLTIFYIAGVSVFSQFGFARYRLAVQPLMILMSGSGWMEIARWIHRRCAE